MTTFSKEITAVLFLKITGLILLWVFCFSHPTELTPSKIAANYTNGDTLSQQMSFPFSNSKHGVKVLRPLLLRDQ